MREYSERDVDELRRQIREERAFRRSSREERKKERQNTVFTEYKVKKKNRFGAFLLALTLFFVSVAGGLLGSYIYDTNLKNNYEVANNQVYNITPKSDYGVVSNVALKVMPSVVGIVSTQNLETIFGVVESGGTGSGVIVDRDGYILTNSHVILDGKAKSIKVVLSDDSSEDAEVIWHDKNLDLAVIKINKSGLTPVELGDSDDVVIGQTAIAIGNPLGLTLSRSVTAGVISGVNRKIQTSNNNIVENLLQTDAAINQGNSGGPLLNDKGELIGINTIKISGQTTEGLGFAIPINTAKEIMHSILENKDAQKTSLGLQIADYVIYKKHIQLVNDLDYGAIILKVEKNSLAEYAGLKINDIILEINGNKIISTDSVLTQIIRYKNNDSILVKILRDGKTQEIDLKLN